MTLGSCRLRKWPAFAPGDQLVLPESRDGVTCDRDLIQELLYSGQWRRVVDAVDDDGLVRLQRKTYTPGITLITPTGDRPEAIQLCIRWMMQQQIEGLGPVQWIVVDDGQEPMAGAWFAELVEKGWMIDHLRREPRDDDPPHTLCMNMRVALPEIKHDKMLIIEDDDYYSPDYVATVSGWLDQADLVGEVSARLYFLVSRSYQVFYNDRLAGWCKTAFRPAVIPIVWHAAASSDQHALDLRVWRGWQGTKYLIKEEDGVTGYCIGIKGVPGRLGHTWSAGKTVADPLLVRLKEWIGADAIHYQGLLGDGHAPIEDRAMASTPLRGNHSLGVDEDRRSTNTSKSN